MAPLGTLFVQHPPTCIASLGWCQHHVLGVEELDGVVGGGHVCSLQDDLDALGGQRLGVIQVNLVLWGRRGKGRREKCQ